MPRLETISMTFYIRPSMAEALKKTADGWGCSVSELVGALVRWGARAIEVEALLQGREDGLDALREALSAGMANWGAVTPALSAAAAVKHFIDYERLQSDLRALLARLGDKEVMP